MLTLEYLSESFKELVSSDADFHEACEIVRQNSSGRRWMIGGFLYRNLVNILYGTEKPAKDFDFIIETSNPEIVLSESWSQSQNRFGNPKFKGRFEIDLVPLSNVYSIAQRQLPPKIEHFLDGTPFNIHSLVYDIDEETVQGEIGREALEKRVFEVNNLEMALAHVELYKTTLNEMIKTKAAELGFRPALIYGLQ
jgi:hypothetical protein